MPPFFVVDKRFPAGAFGSVIRYVYTALRYEWDEIKNLRNQRIHDGVSFEIAALVFEDESCLIAADRIDPVTGEQRWHATGAVQIDSGAAVLLVVHVYREEYNGEEIIRIISARAAEKHEIRRYREQTTDEA